MKKLKSIWQQQIVLNLKPILVSWIIWERETKSHWLDFFRFVTLDIGLLLLSHTLFLPSFIVLIIFIDWTVASTIFKLSAAVAVQSNAGQV